MRVGFITSDLGHHHGWAHYSLSLIEALLAQGTEPAVVITARNNATTGPNLPVWHMLPSIAPAERWQLPKLMAAVGDVRRTLYRCGAQIVHITAEPYAVMGPYLGLPYLITGHGSYARAGETKHPLVRGLHKHAFRRAEVVVCVSGFTAQVAEAATPGIRTEVVNNGIDPARFANLPARTDNTPTVLTVGGVKKRKGTRDLVAAMAHVPSARLVIVGNLEAEPETVADVRALIDRLALVDRVVLAGHVSEEDLLRWYSAADVFALPAVNKNWKFEGYGLALLEASAAGIPVIGTYGNGTADAVRDGETGLLVPQNDPIALAEAINGLLNDHDLAARMGVAGRAFAAAQTWGHVAERMLATYETYA